MVSTPPKTAGSPGEETWKRWVEEQVLGLTEGSVVRDTRVQAVSQLATGAGNVAANNAATVTDVVNGSKGLSTTNRIGRPLTDIPFWNKIVKGDLKMWEVTDANGLVIEKSVAENVQFGMLGSSSTSGNAAIILTPTADLGAEIDVTPILRPPTSRKIYVRMAYPSGGSDDFCPEIIISVRSTDGSQLATPLSATLPPSQAGRIFDFNTLVPLNGIDVFTYMVKLRAPAGATLRAATTAEVFEVIGSGDGLAISPGGISVEDSSGNKTIEINPSAPLLSAPTPPTFDTSLGSVSVKWDGKLGSPAANPPATFSYVRTEESTSVSGPWTRVAQTLNKAGSVVTRPPSGDTRWYRFIAVDTMNRESAPSAAASVVVQGIDIPDLPGEIGDVIDTVDGLNKIFYNAPDNTPTAHANGDLWFVVRPETGTVVDVRIWNGTVWVPYRIVADSVIVPGSVGTVTIADGAITTPKIVARSIVGEHIQVGSISVDELTPNIGQSIDIKINPALADVESGLEQQQRYYRFDNEGLKIGDPATDQELRLNPGRIEMWQGGNVPTYWEASVFHVERMIVDAANIGNHRFERRAGGGTIIRPL